MFSSIWLQNKLSSLTKKEPLLSERKAEKPKKSVRGGDTARLVEYLPSKQKVLGSFIPSSTDTRSSCEGLVCNTNIWQAEQEGGSSRSSSVPRPNWDRGDSVYLKKKMGGGLGY